MRLLEKTYQQKYHGVILLWSSGFFLLFFVLIAAFQQQTKAELAARLKQELSASQDQWPPALLQFYEKRNFVPLWVEETTLTEVARDFLAELDHAYEEGLERENYLNASLHSELSKNIAVRPAQDLPAMTLMELEISMAFLKYAKHVLRGRVTPDQLHAYWTLKQRDVDMASLMSDLSKTPLNLLINRLKPPHKEYADLKDALAAYRKIAGEGGWPIIENGPELTIGVVDERVCSLRKRLQFTCDLPHTRADSLKTFDEALARAVKVFQLRHGLSTTGIVDNNTLQALNVPVEDRIAQLSINMDRWRWMPNDLGPRHIRVNIPGFTLDAFEDGKSVLSMKTIVGTPATPTELFHAEVSHVVVSPYWYVPASIASKEILPQLKKDASYLTRNHMEVRFKGKTINADSIRWKLISRDNFPYILRQKPGPSNSLGELRFTMPNVLNIGMHDTPEKHLFDRTTRAFSHGCIRLENPVGLALFALNDSSWTEERLREIIDYGIEYPLEMRTPVPAYMFYLTAWVDARGLVHFRDDVYNYDDHFKQALALQV